MKTAITMILALLTISFCTNTVQAQARRAPIVKHTRVTNGILLDSISTGRVVGHRNIAKRTTPQTRVRPGSRTTSNSVIERNGRVIDHRRSTTKRTMDHRQRPGIVAPNNRSVKLKGVSGKASSTKLVRDRRSVQRNQ